MAFTAIQIGSTIGHGIYARASGDANAMRLEEQARQEREAALREAESIREAGQRFVSTARVSAAASGVDVNSGSAAMAQDEIAANAEQDALAAILTGERRAGSLQSGANDERRQGRQAQKASYISAMTQAGQGAMNYGFSSGWRARGPGYSGQQAPAPVETRTIRVR